VELEHRKSQAEKMILFGFEIGTGKRVEIPDTGQK
jgi:hypothetical protein